MRPAGLVAFAFASRYIPSMDEDVRTIRTETAMAAMMGMRMMPSPVGRCLRRI
jgi:hypothetical protein